MRLIAIANRRGGFLNFFQIEKYKGQPLEYGDYVFDYTDKPQEIERLESRLKEIKKAYLHDMEVLRKSRIHVAYESTLRQRLLYRSIQKTIKDAYNDKTIGF